jgi:universal stress protein A
MPEIKTVLCPVDFSSLTGHEIDLAIEICRAFGARLVIHHNLMAPAPGASWAWMWARDHHGVETEFAAESRLGELLASLPEELEAQAVLTRGVAPRTVLLVREQVGADLVILASLGGTTEDHTSVTELVLESARCPVLALHSAHVDRRMLRLGSVPGGSPQPVLVATDFSADGARAVTYAFELARSFAITLHLIHVVAAPRRGATATTGPARETRRRLRKMVPLDLEGRVCTHVAFGEPAEEIAGAAEAVAAACVVMGGHARGLVKRFFSHDTPRDLLHRVGCPLWVVPSDGAAAA